MARYQGWPTPATIPAVLAAWDVFAILFETGLETARKEIARSFASMNHLEQRVSDLSQQLKSVMKVTEELSFRWLHAESPQS